MALILTLTGTNIQVTKSSLARYSEQNGTTTKNIGSGADFNFCTLIKAATYAARICKICTINWLI